MNIALKPGLLDLVIVAGTALDKNLLTVSNDLYDIYADESGDLVKSITVLKPHQFTRGHAHSHWETYYFDRGGISLFLDGQEKRINGACRVDIAPNVHHRVKNHTDKPIAFLCNWIKKDVID